MNSVPNPVPRPRWALDNVSDSICWRSRVVEIRSLEPIWQTIGCHLRQSRANGGEVHVVISHVAGDVAISVRQATALSHSLRSLVRQAER